MVGNPIPREVGGGSVGRRRAGAEGEGGSGERGGGRERRGVRRRAVVGVGVEAAGRDGWLGGPAFDVVFDVVGDEEAFEDAFDGVFFVVVEAGDGFELEAQVVVGAAFVVVKEKRVGADGEGFGESLEHVEGRGR